MNRHRIAESPSGQESATYTPLPARRDLDFPFQVTAFRMYNVYGPRQALNNPYQGVFGIFLGNLLRNEPITIFGDGEQSRDFIYVGDIVDAWVGALQTPSTYGTSINLGSGKRLSINYLADAVLSAFDRTRGRSSCEIRGRPIGRTAPCCKPTIRAPNNCSAGSHASRSRSA